MTLHGHSTQVQPWRGPLNTRQELLSAMAARAHKREIILVGSKLHTGSFSRHVKSHTAIDIPAAVDSIAPYREKAQWQADMSSPALCRRSLQVYFANGWAPALLMKLEGLARLGYEHTLALHSPGPEGCDQLLSVRPQSGCGWSALVNMLLVKKHEYR